MTPLSIIGLKENIPLAPYTTIKIGGPARFFAEPETTETLVEAVQEAVKKNVPYIILGSGANVLIADKGFDGLVIHPKNANYAFEGEKLRAEAGVPLISLVMQSGKRGLSGLEFAAGIPSSLGGAVRGNAGSMGSEMKNVVETVEILTPVGEAKILKNKECEFSYRNSRMKQLKETVLAATLKFATGDAQAIRKQIKENFSKKHKTQDLKHPSSGCIFTNPPQAPAGKIIEEAGLKGFRIGGAQVSEVHANFIINKDQATAEDVVMLISAIKQKVRVKERIQLVEEVQYIGF